MNADPGPGTSKSCIEHARELTRLEVLVEKIIENDLEHLRRTQLKNSRMITALLMMNVIVLLKYLGPDVVKLILNLFV